MLVFMTVFLLIFALLNLYVFRWLRSGLDLKRRGMVILLAFLSAMLFMPAALHYCRHYKIEELERILGMITYCWMAIVMWVVSFGFLAEVWNLGVRLAALKKPEKKRFLL